MSKQNPFHTNINNLENLVDFLSQLLLCPVTIEDANHKLLAYSTHHGLTDPARTSTIIERRVPEKIINQLWKEGIIPSLLESKDPIYVEAMERMGLENRLAISIWHNGKVLGFIWALENNKTFQQEDYQLLKQAAEASKNIFLKNKMNANKKEEHEQEFFWKLLISHYKNHDLISETFNKLGLVAPSCFAIVIFQFTDDITETTENKINYLLNTFQNSNVLLSTVDKQNLICLTSISNKDSIQSLLKWTDELIRTMKERYRITPIIQAVSGFEKDLLKVKKAYKEALKVLSIKKKFPDETNHIHSYQHLGFYRYLELLVQHNEQIQYKNESLMKLQKYDEKYQNYLVKTLEVYLNNDCNVQASASLLNIHPNTLSYRLKRIAEIGGIDLKDVTEKMTLFIDLKLNKYS